MCRPLPSSISSYKVFFFWIFSCYHCDLGFSEFFCNCVRLANVVQGSSDDFIDANIQLAITVVRKLQEKIETRACIVILSPS